MPQKQSGGVNIHGSTVKVGGDLVGRDKVNEYTFIEPEPELKNPGVVVIEKVMTFLLSFLIGGICITVLVGGIGLVISQAVGESTIAYPFIVLGLLLSLGFAISATSQVKRTK